MEPLLLSADGITKKYRNIQALRGVSVSVRQGSVTAIVGDNGSGKSTLIRILSGTIRPDSGRIRIENRDYASLTVREAMRAGIRTVYQDLALDNCKNSAENIFLGEELCTGPFLNRRRMMLEASRLLEEIRVSIPDLSEPVRNLSGGQRQGVAIARALRRPGRLLLLDEPTAAMGVQEAQSTLHLLRRLRERGETLLMVSHNLHQVCSIADYVYVMRAGEILFETDTAGLTPEQLQDRLLEQEEAE